MIIKALQNNSLFNKQSQGIDSKFHQWKLENSIKRVKKTERLSNSSSQTLEAGGSLESECGPKNKSIYSFFPLASCLIRASLCYSRSSFLVIRWFCLKMVWSRCANCPFKFSISSSAAWYLLFQVAPSSFTSVNCSWNSSLVSKGMGKDGNGIVEDKNLCRW